MDEAIFNKVRTDASAAKAAADVVTTKDQANEAKQLAENALKRAQSHANKREKN